MKNLSPVSDQQLDALFGALRQRQEQQTCEAQESDAVFAVHLRQQLRKQGELTDLIPFMQRTMSCFAAMTLCVGLWSWWDHWRAQAQPYFTQIILAQTGWEGDELW
ncbi:MAG: hypothetical protein ACFCU3_11780 [Verrucomicrobiales bacterium]